MTILVPKPGLTAPEPFGRLGELAANLWSGWNNDAQRLFACIDEKRWEEGGRNPVRLLRETDEAAWERLRQDERFRELYAKTVEQWDAYMRRPSRLEADFPQLAGRTAAYFSAEFGIHESLPIYSGGLGVLAGDHCKSASDTGLSLVGVGLLYKRGFFTQKLDSEGRQIAEPAELEADQTPLVPAGLGGLELTVEVPLPGRSVRLTVWKAQVGRVPIYLLDADTSGNSPQDRELTAQLYGGNHEMRIAQEILLGVGGLRALQAAGIRPAICHINEGHAAFVALERLRAYIAEGVAFPTALEMVRATTVFTTHTPVPAGHDQFEPALVERMLEPLLAGLAADRQAVLELGRDAGSGRFNMTALALNTSGFRNAVSRLHGQVSRSMHRHHFGGIAEQEVPIGHVTNGVHLDTWLAPEMKELFDRFLPGTWREQATNANQWQSTDLIPAASLWSVHQELKERMIKYARRNIRERLRRNGAPKERIDEVSGYLNSSVLTIGFARRFATYKRAHLLFSDLRRLKRIVNNPDRPVQFIFAGKAHPADLPGQELIREIHRVSMMNDFRGKIVLLENYDMQMARYLVQGVDVWLNTPRRPFEASGTSGQKAAMNGVIHFSVLDGWWEEGYNGDNGWVVHSGGSEDWREQEKSNTDSLYDVLEKEIVPVYYNQGELPAQWTERMKRSIRSIAPVYNSERMVREYVERFYVPSLERGDRLKANDYEAAARLAGFKSFIRDHWHEVRLLGVSDFGTRAGQAAAGLADAFPEIPEIGAVKDVTADVSLGAIWENDIAVEAVYFEENGGCWDPVVVPLERTEAVGERSFRYRGKLPAHLLLGPHFTVRVRPVSADFAQNFELPLLTTT